MLKYVGFIIDNHHRQAIHESARCRLNAGVDRRICVNKVTDDKQTTWTSVAAFINMV